MYLPLIFSITSGGKNAQAKYLGLWETFVSCLKNDITIDVVYHSSYGYVSLKTVALIKLLIES